MHVAVIVLCCIVISLTVYGSCKISESQHSDDESPRRAIMGAPTQAYVCESDEETGTVLTVLTYVLISNSIGNDWLTIILIGLKSCLLLAIFRTASSRW